MTTEILPQEKRNIRITPLKVDSLPKHPSIATSQSGSDVDLKTFITSYLNEALHMTDSIIPNHFKTKSTKSSDPSIAKVDMSQCDALTPETWFRRASCHEDKVERGTADWAEFKKVLFYDHSYHESQYTPDIYDSRCIADWKEEIESIGASSIRDDFEEVGMEIYENAHHLPGGLTNRVFAVLIVRALIKDNVLIVVQRPVDLSNTASAFYSNGKHLQQGKDEMQKGKVIMGLYASVERAKKVEDNKVLWEMALTSDARGWLPMSIQKSALPGAVAKDVGFVMKYVDELRHK